MKQLITAITVVIFRAQLYFWDMNPVNWEVPFRFIAAAISLIVWMFLKI